MPTLTRIDQHLVLDHAALALRHLGELDRDTEERLITLREQIWKKMSNLEVQELEDRWRALQEGFLARHSPGPGEAP